MDDLVSLRIVGNNRGDLYVVNVETDEAVSLTDYLGRRDDHELTLGHGADALRLRFWVFHNPWAGDKVWWSVLAIHRAASIEGMSGVQWVQSWWPWWCKWLVRLGIDPIPHLRRAQTVVRQRDPELFFGVDSRLTEESSASSFAMVALLARWASGGRGKRGSHSVDNSRRWSSVLSRVLQHLVVDRVGRSMRLYMDTTVICEPGRPLMGTQPVDLKIDGGVVELGALAMKVGGVSLFSSLGQVQRMSLLDLLVSSQQLGARFHWFFRQLVWRVASVVDEFFSDEAILAGPSEEPVAARDDPMALFRSPSAKPALRWWATGARLLG